MKSIPSLVASSTVGVAATGLVFARPQLSTPPRPASNKRKASEYDNDRRVVSSPLPRPTTSSAMTTPIQEKAFGSSPVTRSITTEAQHHVSRNSSNEGKGNRLRRKASAVKQRDSASAFETPGEDRKDSIGSRGSWYKRLSIIQPSQNGSPRSSIGLDSSPLSFSTTPIVQGGESPAQQPPNKLVKRTTSTRSRSGNPISRSGSKSQTPTLRRPATSHQRSVTLQQQYKHDGTVILKSSPEAHINSSPSQLVQSPKTNDFSSSEKPVWRPHFESRSTRTNKESQTGVSNDGNIESFYPPMRRVVLPEHFTPPTLLKASMLNTSDTLDNNDSLESYIIQTSHTANRISSDVGDSPFSQASNEEPHKRARRSLSMHFSSPTTWISRSGSVRASKRGENGRNGGKRYSSAPAPPSSGRLSTAHGLTVHKRKDIMDPTIYQKQPLQSHPVNNELHRETSISDTKSRIRNSPSPLPPLSRLSSFNLDMTRLGLSSSSSSAPRRSPTSPISPTGIASLPSSNEKLRTKSPMPVVVHHYRSPRISEVNASDRGSTLIGSDSEARAFASGEEDEMDFQSDTAYDSFRTGATGSIRAHGSRLEMMFDESPPSTGSKTNALHEHVLGAGFHEARSRISEEDESMSTPIKDRRRREDDIFSTPSRQVIDITSDDAIRSSPPSFCLATNSFARLSLGEEEEEEDWTRDDESVALSNPLSPPSMPSSSINSQRVSSAVRLALADVTMSGSSSRNTGTNEDRPRSVFDWSEPLTHEKMDIMGNSPRPKTVHGKQVVDARGGRAIGRRGPTAAHIRSQSVPVVPDVAGHREHNKLTPKFGTWGLGAKGVSEDWDNDFEFDNMDVDDTGNGESSMTSSAMLVPPDILASQANIVGHVGQIREVCLLVDDLKRLRGLAREKGILKGPSAELWREADGIIALATPEEDDETLSPPQSPTLPKSERERSVDETNRGGSEDLARASFSDSIHDHEDLLLNRRRSVFGLPEDDIFGPGMTSSSRQIGSKESREVARSVMQQMHNYRASSNPVQPDMIAETPNKMPFDTTSLRDLVHRASALTRILAEIIRKADGIWQSPHRSPQVDRDSSPAFTRVFTDPLATPPKQLPRSQSSNSVLSGSIDSSPTRSLGQRMHMMTVV